MQFVFVTLFPETISPWLETSMMKRAQKKGLFTYDLVDLREFGLPPHQRVDSPAFGGGGMVLRVEPLAAAIHSIVGEDRKNWRIIVLQASGEGADVQKIEAFSKFSNFIFVCGHYEGIDERFIELFADEVIRWGDLVLTGGELAALALCDAMVRRAGLLEEGVFKEESFSLKDPKTGKTLMEYPHYTRPRVFEGRSVPEVLVGGNHAKIRDWRLEQARKRTASSVDFDLKSDILSTE